jgi:hypothetical protein
VSEHAIQADFVDKLKFLSIEGIDVSFAVPNGGHRHLGVAKKLKAEGVEPGVPDWLWPTARGGFVGLAIEFKYGDGNPTKEQRGKINRLQDEGWCAVICWTASAAIRVVQGYAGMTRVICNG